MAEVVYKLIADDLRARIMGGQLSPGDAVPTEAELSAQWQTSRGPVRNALLALRQEGLIDTARGRPARVRDATAHQPVDMCVPFTRWAREIGAVPGAHTHEVSRRRADARKAALLGIEPGDPVVEVLRMRTLDGRPTMLERLTYTEAAGRCLFDTELDQVSITEYVEQHGFAGAQVDHEIDAIPADAVDAELLAIPAGSPILRLRRVAATADGVIFEASDDRYRSDIVRFTVSASGRSRQGDAYVRPLGSA